MTSFLPIAASVEANSSEWDNVYIGSGNTSHTRSRVVLNTSTRTTLPNFQFGSNVRVDLPQGMLLSTCVLTLKLQGSAIAPNTVLGQGWGYDAISYIEYAFGGSERLRIEGRHMLQKALADCESGSKRAELLALAGAPRTSGVHPDQYAYINLYLPFSNMSSSRVLPFDGGLLQAPCQVRIQFATQNEIFKSTIVAAGTPVPQPVFPSSFQDAYVTTKTAMLIDRGHSLRDEVALGGGESYSYPYIYPLSFTASSAVPSRPRSGTTRASTRVDAFQNGAVASIDLWLALESYTLAGITYRTESEAFNRAYWFPLRDVDILYAGQSIFATSDDTAKLFNLAEYPTSDQFTIAQFSGTAGVIAAADNATTSAWTHCGLSQFNETLFTNLLQSGVNLTNNTLEIRYHTPELGDIKLAGQLTTVNPTDATFTLRGNINYQASVRVADGVAQLLFVPPIPILGSTISGAAMY